MNHLSTKPYLASIYEEEYRNAHKTIIVCGRAVQKSTTLGQYLCSSFYGCSDDIESLYGCEADTRTINWQANSRGSLVPFEETSYRELELGDVIVRPGVIPFDKAIIDTGGRFTGCSTLNRGIVIEIAKPDRHQRREITFLIERGNVFVQTDPQEGREPLHNWRKDSTFSYNLRRLGVAPIEYLLTHEAEFVRAIGVHRIQRSK